MLLAVQAVGANKLSQLAQTKEATEKNSEVALSLNEYTINDAFAFAGEIRTLTMNEDDILVSYDVTALFTNVSLDETIKILR